MGETNGARAAIRLDSVLETLEFGGEKKERTEGLKDLKTIFDPRKAATLGVLDDKSWHKIFEVLFKVALSEKHIFITAKKTVRSTAISRLTTCADLIRLGVKAAVPKLKVKTVAAVIDHIIQTLPNANGEYCQPLIENYLKALSAILEHHANVERLRKDTWIDTVDFCLLGISRYLDNTDREPWNLSSARASYPSRPLLRSTLADTNVHNFITLSRPNAEDLLQSLHSLVAVPNAPHSERFKAVIDAAVRLLQSQGTSVSQLHQVVFSIINHILPYTCTDHISFSQSIAQDVIPIICRFWQGKTVAKDEMLNSVRDEMLISLFIVHLHLERSIRDGEDDEMLAIVESLSDVLRVDYARRNGRDQLQLDDLDMTDFGASVDVSAPFRLDAFQLKTHNIRGERNWANLQAIGILERLIILGRDRRKSRSENIGHDLDNHPRKRQRIARPHDRIIEPLKSEDERLRLEGLQSLPFILGNFELHSSDLRETLSYLQICASDKRGNIAVWALLAIASCTFQKAAGEISSQHWLPLWHLGTRSLTFSATCRTAALQLHAILARGLLHYQDISEDVSAIITVADISGPVILCDSAIFLMNHLLQARIAEVPSSSLVASQHAIRWLSSRWNPADREFAAHYAVHVQPYHIISLLRTSLGLHRWTASSNSMMQLGRLGQTWLNHLGSQDIVRYLLLLESPCTSPRNLCPSCPKDLESGTAMFVLDTAHFNSIRRLILEVLQPKCSDLYQSWKIQNVDQLSPVSTDTFRCAVNSCITMLLATPHFSQASLPQLSELESSLQQFCEELLAFLRAADARDPDGARGLAETLIQCVQPHLPLCWPAELSQLSKINPHLLSFFARIAEDFKKRRALLAPVPSNPDDTMDIDDDFDDFSTQQSHTRAERQKSVMPRQVHALDPSPASFDFVVYARLMLIAAIDVTPEPTGFLPTIFIDQIVALSDEELLLGRPFLHEVIHSDLTINVTDATRLLSRIIDILEAHDFDRCEVTLVLSLDLLIGLGQLWTAEDSPSDLAEYASGIYQWFIDKALKNMIVSLEVQKGIASLLLFLIQTNPEYGIDISLPSARSSLFNLLQKGDASLKFCIGCQLPSIFHLFLLADHDSIFLDILDRLPSDPEWIEGISFRLFSLARLASEWPTLLRRCIYHIFEVPGKLPECIKYATKCLLDVSSALKLDTARELFALFAPQLLYTWLESGDIKNIPFQIFGFSSLQDLVLDVQDEAIGLMIMRGQDSAVEEVARILGKKEDVILQNSFAKVMAYTVAYDTSVPAPSDGKKHITGESRVKKRLGQERFFQCLNLHFADIIAILFNISDPQDNLDKYLMKKEDLIYAGNIMTEIKSLSSSRTTLPPIQQPAFRARYLAAQIAHLCTRTEFESTEIYTQALITSIARKLSNTIHPSLGSLHACSVLRKLRTLICLAGSSVTTGYTLEMLLQIFRPFINDPQCADDAIGITQYLLTSGSQYLMQVPSFVAGIALSILGSMRAFIKAGRASSTQESQHKSTVSRVQVFHKWFGSYLASYNTPLLSSQSQVHFQTLLESGYVTEWAGNADIGTPESGLLLQLLQDDGMTGKLLSRPARELALDMLCSKFQSPASFRTDILGEDESAIVNAVAVWKSCRGDRASSEYLSWAARVLGRAFVASGRIDQDLLRESTLAQIKQLSPSLKETGDSRACVLNILQELTQGYDNYSVGLAEAALRFVMTTSDDSLVETCQKCLTEGLYHASIWAPYQAPPSESLYKNRDDNSLSDPYNSEAICQQNWLRNLSIALAIAVPDDSLLHAVVPVLKEVPGFAQQAFPFILHLVLSTQYRSQRTAKQDLSTASETWFRNCQAVDKNNLKVLINAILYLRTQPIPDEDSSANRLHWLSINYMKAATAAIHCGMYKTALLFVEEYCSAPAKPSRRSSVKEHVDQSDVPPDVLLAIFQNIDDPDLYYGVRQKASLSTILARSEYEKDGPKSLAFRGAQFDSHIRRHDSQSENDAQYLMKSLDVLSLNGLSHSILQSQQSVEMNTTSLESMFRTARKLEQWDIPVPSTSSNNAVTIYKAFQTINTAVDRVTIGQAINESFHCTMNSLVREDLGANDLHGALQTLAALVEMDEVFATSGSQEIEQILARFRSRSGWMKIGRFDDISQILSCRATVLSTLSQQPRLQSLVKVDPVDTRLVEIEASLLASSLNRAHNALQESLSIATSMTDLIAPCHKLSLNVEAAVHVEAANALWDQGEMSASIGMLHALDNVSFLKKQAIPIGRSDLLSKIGHQVSVARLEKADRIIDKYLKPALSELKGRATGSDAGQVFHQFAVFCDQQLQDPDSLEDFERLKKLSKGKKDEVEQWEKLLKTATSSTDRNRYKNQHSKAKTWYRLDEEELQRHIASSEEFLRQSLENYLLALAASDEHDSTALRFSALWLEHAEEPLANDAVSQHLNQVPSRKFASLMNQLTSRLQDSSTKFQKLLFSLVLRIATDHPYHGMYQIYSVASNRPSSKDEAAVLRKEAAKKVASQLTTTERVSVIWTALNATNKLYGLLAGEKDDQKYKSGRRVQLKDSQAATRLNAHLTKYRIPSPTMHIPLAADLNYSKIPAMIRLEPTMSIASGVSAPKIITAIGENGARFKQLVKGGNDDLRQDAIMEQVFEQVSELLKINRSTRQRDLRIRTYKVLPLTSIAGVIEFVPNTIPLHEYLMPAHERYYPKDLKGNQCRKEIGEVQTQSVDVRIKKFRQVTDRFHPVMRYFFTEKFTDPDEWFVKRLAYTRSTAAISILGHVLGLGDRHGHNILLDAESGEVVHIDLGVAFEMGRVLPVPELVPFRLTRDIIDGMGITKTEGVFRRCCEFTLEALRKEAYSIMTILDVLRYDPLYSWSISPVRLAKLQEGQSALNSNVNNGNAIAKEAVNEPGEADRALTVVNKKLSKTLSVQATVNDLINQSSDEKNLAVLYSGWAAYA